MISLFTLFISFFSSAQSPEGFRVLADVNLLNRAGIRIESKKQDLGIAVISEYQMQTLSHQAHLFGKCAGFELLTKHDKDSNAILSDLIMKNSKNNLLFPKLNPLKFKDSIQQMVNQVDIHQVEENILWLSSFKNRFHKGPQANQHVIELKNKIESLLKWTSQSWSVTLIDHQSTPQKSLKVRLEGKKQPNEIVVLGAHLDSINGWGAANSTAPGADDNASGSSNLLEVLRLLSFSETPDRSIEFFWYAGEEAGLLGSAEIAQQYKDQQKDVVGVLQLDMTAFAGLGEGIIGDVTDYTTPTLRQFWKEINALYVKAKIVEDQCGYGCSDHASWYRQGYPTVLPFEANTKNMNPNIHTPKDTLAGQLNMKHSILFTKISVAYAAELANSTWRP